MASAPGHHVIVFTCREQVIVPRREPHGHRDPERRWHRNRHGAVPSYAFLATSLQAVQAGLHALARDSSISLGRRCSVSGTEGRGGTTIRAFSPQPPRTRSGFAVLDEPTGPS